MSPQGTDQELGWGSQETAVWETGHWEYCWRRRGVAWIPLGWEQMWSGCILNWQLPWAPDCLEGESWG